ncbi:Aspartic peptidase domain containing protein [Parasponia andersonii]|uniref:Aspartic peptidase domain containing protein n=1 Tax=Parasponia andersonii TaxID=3476 RepID=A0A2P5C7P6_PARAD|nr:Aspartic peptidase domain containing protein [Parasponia andersonii]
MSNRWDNKKKKKEGESSFAKRSDPSQSKGAPQPGCYLCDGPHCYRDCPTRRKINAIVSHEELDDEENPTTRVNPLQLLNAISGEKQSSYKGLMYVSVLVNGRVVRAMLDTGAQYIGEKEIQI